MKFKVKKDELVAGLQKVCAIINNRPTLPVLANVLLVAEGEHLTLSASDLELGLRIHVTAEVGKSGGTTLPAKQLMNICRELPGREIEFAVDASDIASITARPAFSKLHGISEDDFPPLPRFEGGFSYQLPQSVLRDMLEKTHYAASNEDSRRNLNGVLLSFKGDQAAAVGTDGRRLALVEQEVEFPAEAEADYLLPLKTVGELLRTLSDDAETPVRIQAAGSQISFDYGSTFMVSRLLEEKYPNFRQVIPTHCEERVAFEREALLDAVKRVSIIAGADNTRLLRMVFTKNQVELSVEVPEVGESREVLPIKYGGKDLMVAFNPEFVMDPLRRLHGDEVYLELTDDLSPGLMKADVPFLYVLMPMRMNQ
ncbi:MAG: DNA polymerase III subunit beta [Candidatus Marinimicrobia bacterium]|nr:DNA polymerase III subunit beta [Candidatus Neomarinimicrobiota bacterium]